MTRPRLAYVVNALNPGGTEKLVVDMSRAFADEFELHVICLDEPGTWAGSLRSHGIPVHCLWRQPGLDLAMPRKLAKFFRDAGIQIIHAHQCTPWFYSALSRIGHPRPKLLLEEHGRFFPEVRNRKRELVNKALIQRLTHCFVAVSRDVRSRLQRYEGLCAERIRVIYNGVTAPEPMSESARNALRTKLGFAQDEFVVGTVGRFDPIKNLKLLVRAVQRAGESDARVRALLVGDGSDFKPVQELVEALGLGGRVVLTGYRDDARRLTQVMDLFVLSSFSEGTSMALLDAMAASVPAAVTSVGGNPEIVVDGVTGWVVPSDDVAALARAIVDAAGNSVELRKRAQQGRSRFEQEFQLVRMLDQYRELYREMLHA